MLQFASYFLGVLIILNLRPSLAAFQEPEIQDKLDGIKESLKTMITKEDFETKLQDLQNQLDDQFLALQNSSQDILNKLPQKKLSRNNLKHIPPKFEQIDSRYFYIENNEIQDWPTAGETCRQMGGYLAAIQNESELNALKVRLATNSYYWLGIHDREEKGEFVSLATGKAAKFLKWHIGYPRNYTQVQGEPIVLQNEIIEELDESEEEEKEVLALFSGAC
ncbi:uncharacterized protein [Drosophila takahashii]|uniref:uncharacterized protein n=1 Tax=Drosophila takahashii TaxID=29030 RepID=UPI001CF8175B|nr:uncharacterized protein LOC108065466 [Drosophila takahashii]